jgi:integrase
MYQRSRVALFNLFLRYFSTQFATLLRLSAHGAHTTLPSYTKLPSGSWRVQIRHKGRYVNETFLRRDDARRWATDTEARIDRGEAPLPSRIARLETFGDLIDLHIADMCAVGKAPRRSKAATLNMLKRKLGKLKMVELDRARLIKFGRDRGAEGCGPVTLGIDIGTIKLVLGHAAAVHGLPVQVEPVDLARIALKRLHLIGKGQERDRRPTQEELDQLICLFDTNSHQITPIGRIIRFAVATAMRQEEICRVTWPDVDTRTRMLTIRDRKDPRKKDGNHQRIPLFAATGYDAWAIIEEQRAVRRNEDPRIFPYNGKSIGTAFRRGCRELKITDLHFHDLRHEGTSRLFEAGFTIEQVALVTGHKDWKMLRRYTHLKPELLHSIFAAKAA